MAYASAQGHALIDRELYLPASWAEDWDRRRAAGIPDRVQFATKPAQAQAMIARAIAANVPFSWFTADEVYGQAKWLQAWLEEHDVSYVMAVRRSDTLTTSAGEQRADALIAALAPQAWQRISAGAGAHGPREFHWARVAVRPGWERGRGHWVLPAARWPTRRRSPITPAPGPAAPAPPGWPRSPAAGGTSKNVSSRPKARPGWTTTRSAPGGPGMPTSPCPCSPWPGWPPAEPRHKKRGRHQRPRPDRLHVTGDPPPADQPDPAVPARPRSRVVLVALAATTPIPGPALPLPATRLRTHLSEQNRSRT